MRMQARGWHVWPMAAACLAASLPRGICAQEANPFAPQGPSSRPAPVRDVLSSAQWATLERTVGRGLDWLARNQQADGSWYTLSTGQPGVTALCVLAFLSAGHEPGKGRHGAVIDRGLNYVLAAQHPDGLLARHYPSMPMVSNNPSHTAIYNHAIAGLMLSEAFGMTHGQTHAQIRKTIEAALGYTRQRQLDRKKWEGDLGGWRYVKPWPVSDSDLSVTSWQLMFLRSCRNAGFDVPAAHIDEAMEYVKRCYDPRSGRFLYALYGENRRSSRGMTGAGILALSLGGLHGTEAARTAGDWVLNHPYDQFNARVEYHDRFFYGAFYCSQGMFQLGGRYAAEFYPVLLRTLATHQQASGCWDAEANIDEVYGNTYSTALAVLALTPPYQLLPIFQR